MNSLHRVVIFGATSAIAHSTARLLAARGASLYCVARNPQKLAALLDDLRVRAGAGQTMAGEAIDLDECSQHQALFDRAVACLGGLDAVLVAQGTLPDQAACAAAAELALREIHTNALAPISLLSIAGARLEPQGHGVIAAIGSVAGDRGRQSNYVYGSAKGMLAIFLQGLRNRLAPAGIAVVTIKPGFVDTPMTAALKKTGPLWATPGRIAVGIERAMRRGTDVVYLPWFWRPIMLVIQHVPEAIFKRLKL